MTEELSAREQVWVLLSELFLDTDITPRLGDLAGALAASPFDGTELERMVRDEVCPVCIWNLYAAAGNWTGFDATDLIGRIERHKARNGLWRGVMKPVHAWNLRGMVPEWPQIRAQIAAIRRAGAQAGGGIPK